MVSPARHDRPVAPNSRAQPVATESASVTTASYTRFMTGFCSYSSWTPAIAVRSTGTDLIDDRLDVTPRKVVIKLFSRLLAVAILAGVLAVICTRLWRGHITRRELAEPHVGSVPLSRYLLSHPASGRSSEVEATISQAGSRAVPALVRVAEWGMSPLELRFRRLWTLLPRPLQRATAPWILTDPGQSEEAMRLLGSLGSDASNSVPALIRLSHIHTERNSEPALVALLAIAPHDPRVRPLELAWLSSNSLVASYYFQEAHCTYPEAVPILVRKIIADPGGSDNEQWALAQYGAAASNALPTLRTLFQAGKGNALSVLLAMGPPAAPAAEELAVLLGGAESMDLRILDGLRRIGPGAAVTLPRVEPYLTATNPVTRLLAETTVASLRGEPSAVLPSFQRTLEAHRPFGTPYEVNFPFLGNSVVYDLGPRQMACWFAGEMGSAAAPILPSLEACFDDEREALRILAAWGHWRIAHRAAQVLPVLRAVLRDPNSNAQHLALCALAEIGPPAAAAEPELQAIRTADLETRRLVNLALIEIHRTSPPK